MKTPKITLSLPKINLTSTKNVNNPLANLNTPIKDTVSFTGKNKQATSINDATEKVANMKSKYGGSRFKSEEVAEFKTAYKKGEIDLETINTFKDNTFFEMKDMKKVYALKETLEDDKFYDKVNNAISEMKEEKAYPEGFDFNKFEPLNEFSLTYKRYPVTHAQRIVDKYYPLGYNFKFDTKTGKMQEASFRKLNEEGDNLKLFSRSLDLRNKTLTTQHQKFDDKQNGFILTKQIIERKNDNDETISTEVMKPSKIKGMYDVDIKYPNEKVDQIAKSTIDPKTGIKTIKKDMKSANGTRTRFLYEDDPKGNRILDYKNTDKNGKILMGLSQTFEVIDDNHFISSKNGYKYDIKTTDKNLTVKNLHTDKEVSLDFKKKFDGNTKELKNLMKKVSGDELFEVVDCVNKISGGNSKETKNSYYDPKDKSINTGDNLMVFLHELGHAQDRQVKNAKGKEWRLYTNNEDIQKTYLKERENFNKNHSDIERETIDYFTQVLGHYSGKWGGLAEVVAETNAITNTYTDKEAESIGPRSHYLQQHFPETIAKIQDAMNWKDDLNAIEYYGT